MLNTSVAYGRTDRRTDDNRVIDALYSTPRDTCSASKTCAFGFRPSQKNLAYVPKLLLHPQIYQCLPYYLGLSTVTTKVFAAYCIFSLRRH